MDMNFSNPILEQGGKSKKQNLFLSDVDGR